MVNKMGVKIFVSIITSFARVNNRVGECVALNGPV